MKPIAEVKPVQVEPVSIDTAVFLRDDELAIVRDLEQDAPELAQQVRNGTKKAFVAQAEYRKSQQPAETPSIDAKPKPEAPAPCNPQPQADPETSNKEQLLPIKNLKLDDRLQVRERLDTDAVFRYQTLHEEGSEAPPIRVYLIDQQHFVVDGFHRVAAYRKTGAENIPAEVKEGTWDEALEEACKANADTSRALPLTTGDRSKMVRMLLSLPQYQQKSDREIARICGNSPTTVGTIRSRLSVQNGQMQPETRQVTRNGTTYEQKRRTAPPKPEPAETVIANPEPEQVATPSETENEKTEVVSTAQPDTVPAPVAPSGAQDTTPTPDPQTAVGDGGWQQLIDEQAAEFDRQLSELKASHQEEVNRLQSEIDELQRDLEKVREGFSVIWHKNQRLEAELKNQTNCRGAG